ncbi:PP2C family protein-serine/threonine phosphatase [Mycobacterium sp. IDR2000157661]|uniref:PP2C family protein-serine/threonine phosphatase n=1 Tax=Mycobacterium sp. IDR2000157661 TaxID=2867005 RepID=UPI001EEE6838|nr:GAF domain-containing SpoIIE family protein phosphatase [Mycobacterium sp. IDR2000157661]ULE35543.1 SpoIIE family protein phosphatase [Mycobacterium sp. IDR2000157661]
MTPSAVDDRFALPVEVEEQRLRSLQQLHILDTPEEERFERIIRLTQLVFQVPRAYINFIDRDRQWCKQAVGEGVAITGPRETSVCRATIARVYDKPEDPALVIDDLTTVPDFAELPAIAAEGGIRFYAGFPLFGPGGHAVGTFCIYDTKPRSLDARQRAIFRDLAAWAQREVERSDDVERAAAVQRLLLPPPVDYLPGYSVCAMCAPAYAVGGDFYDHYPVQRGAIFTVADVMGKGLGAALITASLRSALRGASRAVDDIECRADLADAVNSAADQMADDLERTNTFATLFHAHLEAETGRIQYVDAGHGIAAVLRRGGVVERLESRGLPLGVLPDDNWVSMSTVLGPGDMVVVASDGSLELLGKQAVESDVLDFVAAHPEPADLCRAVTALTNRRPPLDDVTVVAVRRDDA